MPTSAAVRLSTKLRNRKTFTMLLGLNLSRLGGNLPQELNVFLSGIRSEVLAENKDQNIHPSNFRNALYLSSSTALAPSSSLVHPLCLFPDTPFVPVSRVDMQIILEYSLVRCNQTSERDGGCRQSLGEDGKEVYGSPVIKNTAGDDMKCHVPGSDLP